MRGRLHGVVSGASALPRAVVWIVRSAQHLSLMNALLAMRRFGISLLTLALLPSACGGTDKEPCGQRGVQECRGNVQFICEVSPRDEDYEQTFWTQGFDCGATSSICRSGRCVVPDASCRPEQKSRCHDEGVAECVDGFAVTGQLGCDRYGSDSHCMDVVDDAGARAVCAVGPEPCDAGRCEGRVAFHCHDGYIRQHHECLESCVVSSQGQAACGSK